MLKNYLKIAWRNLIRSKGFSFINIFGLTIGMASAILILLWVQNEASTDRIYDKTSRIYRLYNRIKAGDGSVRAVDQTTNMLASALQKDYPEVEAATRYTNVYFLVSAGEKHLNIRGAFADSAFLSLFNFPMIVGNATQSLNSPSGIVLTEHLAKSLFGETDVIGKTVRIDSNRNFTVTSVLKELPANTTFTFDYLLPWSYMTSLGWEDSNWTNNYTITYALLKKGTSQAAFDQKIKRIIIDHTKGTALESKTEVFTQPLARAYLYSSQENGQLVTGRIVMVRLFAIIAGFILLIACINFMNLSTARSERRAKEVGIRKVSGAQRGALIAQFIGESIILSFIAFMLATLIVELSLPAFDELVGKTLTIDFSSITFWLFSLAFILFTGLLAGSYPALYLSSFAPVKVLKGTFKNVNALVTPRKVLVILQFSFAILLILATLIIQTQISYVQQRDIGYKKDLLAYSFVQGDAPAHYSAIRQELLSSGAATSVTRSANPIVQRWGSGSGYEWNGSTDADHRTDFVQMGADADMVKTMGLTLLQGRDINVYEYPGDTMAVLLNESAVRAMRLKNPVGQIIKRKNYPTEWHVVGIVKDFVLESPFESTISPTVINGPSFFFQVMHFKLNPANSVKNDLAKVEAILKKYNPQYPAEYSFVDEAYSWKFKDVERTGKLSLLFAGLTILISCLGLFGLAAYMAESRTKEIGIRKVLGAKVTSITFLLSSDFLKLVGIAFLIASPLAWFAMNSWLGNYTYRIQIGWWEFACTGLGSMLIALITVSYQAIRAALANPARSLHAE